MDYRTIEEALRAPTYKEVGTVVTSEKTEELAFESPLLTLIRIKGLSADGRTVELSKWTVKDPLTLTSITTNQKSTYEDNVFSNMRPLVFTIAGENFGDGSDLHLVIERVFSTRVSFSLKDSTVSAEEIVFTVPQGRWFLGFSGKDYNFTIVNSKTGARSQTVLVPFSNNPILI